MATTMLLTAEDLLRLPDDGAPHELIRGELRTMTPAGGRHGAINARITLRLGNHVETHDLGLLLTEATGFRLSEDPETVRCPDVSFLSRARIPAEGIPSGFIDGAPDLAVEVLSPGDTVFEIEEKVEDYLAAGCLLVWVVNPQLRRVTVREAGGATRVLGEGEVLQGGEVLPGFACPVGELFV